MISIVEECEGLRMNNIQFSIMKKILLNIFLNKSTSDWTLILTANILCMWNSVERRKKMKWLNDIVFHRFNTYMEGSCEIITSIIRKIKSWWRTHFRWLFRNALRGSSLCGDFFFSKNVFYAPFHFLNPD